MRWLKFLRDWPRVSSTPLGKLTIRAEEKPAPPQQPIRSTPTSPFASFQAMAGTQSGVYQPDNFRWSSVVPAPDQIIFPARKTPLPHCLIRAMQPQDFDACADIYRLNEPGRFPAGYFDHFEEQITRSRNLVVVAEVEGKIRGLGSIGMLQQADTESAWLGFGMVHPDYQKQGFGTTLLLARLACLPQPQSQWTVFMAPLSSSKSFYKRFGIIYDGNFVDERGTTFSQYHVRLNRANWQKCQMILDEAQIVMDKKELVVPSYQSS